MCAKLLSHVWLFATPWTIDHEAPMSMEILQARILESVAISSFRGSFQPRDQTCISCASCIGRQILYHWATWEDPNITISLVDIHHLYVISPELSNLTTGNLYLLIPFYPFCPHPHGLGKYLSVLCIWVQLFQDFMYKWDHTVFIFL